MRVIAGQVRGFRLEVPEGPHVRPTSDRVREALFSILMPKLEGARFLDLFAGSGANGIEALSRGASHAVFVDDDARALQTVYRNLKKTHLLTQSRCLRLRLPEGLSQLRQTFDIIFADPPYAFAEYPRLLESVAGNDCPEGALLDAQGLFVIETHKRTAVPEEAHGMHGMLKHFRASRYGDTLLHFYHWE